MLSGIKDKEKGRERDLEKEKKEVIFLFTFHFVNLFYLEATIGRVSCFYGVK